MFRKKPNLEMASEYDAALLEETPFFGVVAVVTAAICILGFVLWAGLAKLDEVTRGDGKVIPSSKTQLVQSLEGGIIKDVLVRTGDTVQKGDVLVRIDDTGFSSNLGEVAAKALALGVKSARLRHEAEGELEQPPAFPADLNTRAPNIVSNELSLFKDRQKSLASQLNVLQERVEQRLLELKEAKASMDRAKEVFALANQEMKLKKPLADRGIVPKTDLIRLQREVADASGQISVLKETLPKLEASIRESKALMSEQRQKFREEARAELSQVEAELSVSDETLRGAKDRVARTDIKSPVAGIVNKLNANTVGGVVQAGQTILEIVPLDDALLVEARIRPADIAFVHPNQRAVVKLTAYDFSIYGGLEGNVELISADSVYDEQLRESFYLVTIKTVENRLKAGKEELPIIPGMVASVDILTGKKSVLDYLLKPINKARQEALRER
jgi:membrane fusion protein, adhesin transport system